MLGSLFKRGWQSDSAATRQSSIEEMDSKNVANQSIFEDLGCNDLDTNVRHTALSKIKDAAVVFDISESHSDIDTQSYARQVFAKLIGIKSEITQDNLLALSKAKPKSIPYIIQYSQYVNIRSEFVAHFSEAELAEMIGRIEYTDTRTLIADKIESIDALEIARKGLKGKDKNAEKIIKEKIDVIHAQQKLQKENEENALFLCEKMEYLRDHLAVDDWRAEFKGQFNVWSQRWNDMDYIPNDDIKQRYGAAYEKVNTAVIKITKISEAQTAQNRLLLKLENQCKQLSSLSIEALSAAHQSISKELKLIIDNWSVHNDIVSPEEKIKSQFENAKSSLQSVLLFIQMLQSDDSDKLLIDDKLTLSDAINHIDWKISDLSLASKSEALTNLEKLNNLALKDEQSFKDKLDKLHKRIHRLLGVTKQGNLAQARRELAAITKIIENYSGKEKIILDERLVKANEVVTKMVDWNNFVTEPKYLELCDAMESLVGVKANPDKLAKKIHALQEKWKGLGYSDSSETHWERFKTAADKAYAPCSEFFKQRQVVRRENLAKREPFLTQMRDLWEQTDWEDTLDYKSIEVSVQQIMRNWQKVKDVEQGPGQKQWKKLTKFKSNINEKLDLVYDANIELKNKLIEQTNALLELDVNDQTLTKLKLFQSRWKQIGITRRKQDQAAWKKFKTASDDVFAKIQGLRKEVRAEEDAQINQYRDISKQIQSLAKTASDKVESDKQYALLQSNYEALPDLPQNLPEKLIKGVKSDYRRACDAYLKANQRLVLAERSKVFDQLKQKAELCSKLEQLGDNATSSEADDISKSMNDIVITDKALAKKINSRIISVANCDLDEGAKSRKKMCIDLEILMNIESPEQDKALRMNLQLENMKKSGLGQNPIINSKLLEKIQVDWYCNSGADKVTQDQLDKRFNSLVTAVRNKIRN